MCYGGHQTAGVICSRRGDGDGYDDDNDDDGGGGGLE